MPTRLLLVLALVACGCSPPAAETAAGRTDPAARDLVARHLARYDALTSLELRVERTTTAGRSTRSESWTFRQKGPDRFRVDYTFPHARTIVGTPTVLWEYIPAAKKAARTDLAALDDGARAVLLAAVLSRVAVNGLRFGVDAGALAGDRPGAPGLALVGSRTVDGRPAQCVEVTVPGKLPRGLRGWLDTERLVLLRCEFLADAGQVVGRVDAANVAEAAPGIWFPGRLTFQAMGPQGGRQEIVFTRVRVNTPMEDALFTFVPPDGVEVVSP